MTIWKHTAQQQSTQSECGCKPDGLTARVGRRSGSGQSSVIRRMFSWRNPNLQAGSDA